MAVWVISQVSRQASLTYLACCLSANILRCNIVPLTFADWLRPPEAKACETCLLLSSWAWVFGDTQLSTASKWIESFFPEAHPTQDSSTVIVFGSRLLLVWRGQCGCQKKEEKKKTSPKKSALVSHSLASLKVFWSWKILNLSELTFFSVGLFSPLSLSGRQLFSPWSGTSSTASPQICLWRLLPFLNGG